MRGTWIRIGIAAALLVAAFVVAVVVLNSTVYSASGFVRTYLDALVRHDARSAIALAGPAPSSSALDDLLTPDVMPDLTDVIVTEEPDTSALPTGHRIVHVAFTANGTSGSADFEVEHDREILGLFDGWSFTSSPLVQVELTVLHARQFAANGAARVTPVTDAGATYLAFAPGAITFGESTEYTQADPRTIVLGAPGRTIEVQLVAEANDALTSLVSREAKAYLDDCAQQTVLYPTGCPFGEEIADRVAPGAAPQWTIGEYPAVTIQPTATLGQWQVIPDTGVAHLHVDVQSIYDGSIAPLDTDVPFAVGYVATFVGEEQLALTPQPAS